MSFNYDMIEMLCSFMRRTGDLAESKALFGWLVGAFRVLKQRF